MVMFTIPIIAVNLEMTSGGSSSEGQLGFSFTIPALSFTIHVRKGASLIKCHHELSAAM